MTVEVYKGRLFEYGHERRALGRFLQELKNRFGDSDTLYIVVIEIDANGAAADLLLLSNRTMIIADLKELTAAKEEDARNIQIEGGSNGVWKYSIGEGGEKIPLGGYSNKGKNPYKQLEGMRHNFADWLSIKIPALTGDSWNHNTSLKYIKSWAVLSPGFNELLEKLELPWEDIQSQRNWFKLIPLNKLAWEFHCTTDLNFEFTERQLHAIVDELGATKVENWGEILPEYFPADLPPLPSVFLFSRINEMGELIGRDHEVDEVMQWLLQESTSIIAINGAGGVGKTSLLGYLAKQTSNSGWRIRYLSCKEKEFTIETFLAAIASEVDDRVMGRLMVDNKVPLIDRLELGLNFLEDQKTILMIDDFQKITSKSEINKILLRLCPRSSNLKAIIASREHPEVIDDPNLPFNSWKELNLTGLEKGEIPSLFTEQQRKELTTPNLDWVWERTSGNPYAIGLLKPLINKYGWGEHIRNLPLYQNDKSAWFDSLIETLDKESKQLALRLSVIQTEITEELINRILHDPKHAPELTCELVEKFVIQRINKGNNYVMHDFIREYLYDHFTDQAQKTKTHIDVGKYYKHIGESTNNEYQSGDQYFEAIYHFDLANQDNKILELSLLAFDPLKTHGDFDRANTVAQKALKAARKTNKPIEIARWLVNIASWKLDHDQFRDASAFLQQAISQLPTIDDKTNACDKRIILTIKANISIEKGRIAYSISEYSRSKEHFIDALEIIKEIGDQRLYAECLMRLARIERQRGEIETSRSYLEEAKRVAEQDGNESCIIQALSHLALIARQKNDLNTAQELFTEAYLLAEKIGDWRGYETNYSLLGDLDRRQGRYIEASEKFRICLETSRKVGNGIAIRINLGQLAESLIRSGRMEEAKPLLEEVEERCNNAGDGVGIAWTLYRKGLFLKESGNQKGGNDLINQAINKLHEIGSEVYIKDFVKDLGPTQENLPGISLK